MQHISSRQNAIVARYRAARDRRHDTDAVLLDGVHLVQDALAAGAVLRDVVVAAESIAHDDVAAIVKRLARARTTVTTASPAVMSALSPVRSASPVVALMERPASDDARVFAGTTPLAIVAVDVQDPGNVGAIVRVAEAASASGVVIAGRSADPFGWKAVRGSMGSALRLPIARVADVADAVAAARRHRCCIFAAVPRGGRSLFDLDFTEPSAVLIGGEGGGLPDAIADAADERVTIPMRDPVESLNAAVTAAVVLYEARRQRTIPD